MLLEFSVTNFRSIKEKQTISFIKAKLKDNNLKDNYTTVSLSRNQKQTKSLEVLRSAVMYGANASGKSNIVLALKVMIDVIDDSFGYKQNEGIPNIEPFLLSNTTRNQPTEFEIDFINNENIRMVYGFSATKEKIIDEWLFSYPKGRAVTLIERTDTHHWGKMDALKGNKKAWKDSTKDNSLFLSTARQYNSEQLKFKIGLRFLDEDIGVPVITHKKSEENKEKILDFLKESDSNITEFTSKEKLVTEQDLPDFIKNHIESSGEDINKFKTLEVKTYHQSEEGETIEFKFKKQESQGTQKMFALAGYWLDVLENGYTVVIDELNNSLHPHLVKFLVNKFHSSANTNGAQLLFTTHETSLLNPQIIRRDQVWFCDKSHNATAIYSLVEFRSRKDDAFEKFYLSGRYGAIPYIEE